MKKVLQYMNKRPEPIDFTISYQLLKLYLERKCPLVQFGHSLGRQRTSSGSILHR